MKTSLRIVGNGVTWYRMPAPMFQRTIAARDAGPLASSMRKEMNKSAVRAAREAEREPKRETNNFENYQEAKQATTQASSLWHFGLMGFCDSMPDVSKLCRKEGGLKTIDVIETQQELI